VGEAPRCEACGRFLGTREWRPPYCVELEVWGSDLADVAFGPGDSLLVSGRFASGWHEEELVGLDGFDPVQVMAVRRHGTAAAGSEPYLRVSVARSDIAVDQERSHFDCDPPTCPACRLSQELRSWSGIVLEAPPQEDIFIARGLPGVRLASERFRQFCERRRLSNVLLIPDNEAHGNWPRRPAA